MMFNKKNYLSYGILALFVSSAFISSCKKQTILSEEPSFPANFYKTEAVPTLTVFPTQVKQQMKTYGVDVKLSVNKFMLASNKTLLSQYLFTDLSSVLRIPIRVWQQEPVENQPNFSVYDDLLQVMAYAKTAKPNIKFFASPAEDDANLNGGNEYPLWLGTGAAFRSRRYGKLVAAYINYFKSKGYNIEYVGPHNEDGEFDITSFHWARTGIIENLNAGIITPKFIGPDRWGIEASKNYANSIIGSGYENEYDILGSHFYDDDVSSAPWTDFVTASTTLGVDAWATESTRFGVATGLDGLIAGFTQFWDPVKSGVSGIIVYQGVNALIKVQNDGSLVIDEDYYGFKQFANSTVNKNRVGSSGTADIKLLAFKNTTTNNYTVVAMNTSTTAYNAVPINFSGASFGSTTATQKQWKAGSAVTGTTSTFNFSGASFTTDIPARSITFYTF